MTPAAVALEDSLWHMFGVVVLTMLLGMCIGLINVEIGAAADLVGWDVVGHEESARTTADTP